MKRKIITATIGISLGLMVKLSAATNIIIIIAN